MVDDTFQTAVCTIRFDEADDADAKLHGNISADSDRITLNQFCGEIFDLDTKLTSNDEMNCMPYSLTICVDDGTCLHNHQETDVKSYVRCGVTRPFISNMSSAELAIDTSY